MAAISVPLPISCLGYKRWLCTVFNEHNSVCTAHPAGTRACVHYNDTCFIISRFCFVLNVDITLENNEDLAERLTKKAIPTKDYYDITGEDGHSK